MARHAIAIQVNDPVENSSPEEISKQKKLLKELEIECTLHLSPITTAKYDGAINSKKIVIKSTEWCHLDISQVPNNLPLRKRNDVNHDGMIYKGVKEFPRGSSTYVVSFFYFILCSLSWVY